MFTNLEHFRAHFSDYLGTDLVPAMLGTGAQVYVVGGSVRDLLLGREVHDVDLCHSLSVEEMFNALQSRGFHVVPTGMDFGVFQVVLDDGRTVDVAEFRAETYKYGDRHPDVVRVQTVEEDLARRDFTVNALALEFHSDGTLTLVDPFGGLADLEAGVVRAVGNPTARFTEDALRVLRGVRFASALRTADGRNFRMDEETARAMREMVGQ